MGERYEVRGKLGRGGMSTVYRAFDHVMGREVALKRLLDLEDTNLNEDSKGALEREAGALAKFQHPNVVTIFALEEDADGPYVAMELVEGEDLNEVVKDAALSVEDFIDVAEQCLDALVSAGEMNLLHRDIKPANIMLTMTPSDRFLVKILDFGLAKFSQQPSTQTLDHQGSFLGSIDYIAPEQLELKPLDQRTDLYSLGCVFYCGLTQESAFQGGSPAETSMNHINHRCTPIQEIRKDLPEHLAAWIMRLISRNPDDRPADAMDAMDQFQKALKGIPYAGAEGSGQVDGADHDAPLPTAPPPEPPGGRVPTTGPAGTIQTGSTKTIQTGPTRSIQTGALAGTPGTGARRPVTGSTRSVAYSSSLSGTGRVANSGDKSFPIFPITAGVVGLVVVIAGIAFFHSGGEDDHEVIVVSDSKAEVEDVEKNVVGKKSDIFPEPATDDLPYPGALKLAEESPVFPELSVSDGLVGHFNTSRGVFERDYQSNARAGSRIAAWVNLVSPGEPLASLTRDYRDTKGNALPLLQNYSPEDLPGLKRNQRGVLLSNRASMEARSKAFDFSNGISFVAAIAIEMRQETIIRFSKNPWDQCYVVVGASNESVYASVSMGPGSTWQRIDTGWWDREPGVIGYVCDVENSRHRFFKIEKSGSVESTDFEPFEGDLAGRNRFSIGRGQIASDVEKSNGHVLFEFAVYDRVLSDEEMKLMQEQLFDRYFKSDRE